MYYITPSVAGKKLESYVNHVKRLQENTYFDNQSGRKLKTQDLNYVYNNYHKKQYLESIVKYCTTADKYVHILKYLIDNRRFIRNVFNEQLEFVNSYRRRVA